VLVLNEHVWDDTVQELRTCGARGVECVMYWVGPIDRAREVDRATHPVHTSTGGHYRVDEQWMHRFLVSLHREKRTIRAQVHTHRGRAFHSTTDDAWPAVNTPGFYSLVIPGFAREPLDSDRMWLAMLRDDGDWDAVRPRDFIRGLP
jgi:hypothetical protein